MEYQKSTMTPVFLPGTSGNTELSNPKMGDVVQGAGEGGKIRSFVLDVLAIFYFKNNFNIIFQQKNAHFKHF